ncbi:MULTISPECIES: DUF1156 domain-containing protein [Methylomonas]|uniref:DUF1156 domain-containing protein n=1 Tax=Methylomonas koyamae TaxID=702114 RepID=A0AA91DBB1_9GAMM|nr:MULTISPECIES: DUF1156 domain-containing protein [Methylomonas]ANE58039.1 hypothetical protein AYM39_22435 [Methylomonas sp. DH-1]OAI24233.1 hypothetical protein A1356_16265 [Methylomonas koyamae]
MSSNIKAPKKLIEVALPLDDINKASAHEKSVKQGHPSSLHLYWARRPLAAARAVIFAQMVNDPGGERGYFSGKTRKQADQERERLFDIIRDLVKWDNINNEAVLKRAYDAICHSWHETCELNKGKPGFDSNTLPILHDPFAGGGAIPSEAQRLGLQSVSTDLNPLALIINHAMTDFPSQFIGVQPIGPESKAKKQKTLEFDNNGLHGLCEDIFRYSNIVKEISYQKIGYLFDDLKEIRHGNIIAWIWARTVESPNPAARGRHVPLVKSFVLSKKKNNYVWIDYEIDESMEYSFVIKSGTELPTGVDGTINRSGAQCILTNTNIPLSYIREHGKQNKLKYRLMAIVAEGKKGRDYFAPSEMSEELALSANPSNYPSSEIEHWAGCTNCVVYGYRNFEDLFTKRQLLALTTFSDAIKETREIIIHDALKAGMPCDVTPAIEGGHGATAYADVITTYLAFSLDKMADLGNSFCAWEPIAQCPRHLFGKQAIPMVWDFAEANPFSNSSGSWSTFISGIVKGISKLSVTYAPNSTRGIVYQADAKENNVIKEFSVISTDPPYYDNVPYSNLSDFFYIWLRRTLRDIHPTLFSTINVPKMPELVANQFRHGGKDLAEKFFLEGMTDAITNMANNCHPAFPVTIYYAFKASDTRGTSTSSSGWETFLESVLSAGFTITGTWPLNTENATRMRGQGSNALASSILLVCRKKDSTIGSISRRQFQKELREKMPEALETMIGGVEGSTPIAPVDLAQAAIGPGMGIFSQYQAVLNQDGSPMSVHDALILINREITDYLNPDSGNFDNDTLFCSSWFDQYGWSEGPFGEADTLSRAKGTTVDGVKKSGVIESGGGKVRLMKWEKYPGDWDPKTDHRMPVWEACHHLIRALNKQGETEAGQLLARMPEKGEAIRQLAYHLYTLCERKKWAEEARAYNELITSWHGIVSASHEIGHSGTQTSWIEE